jgi:DNA primase large subunit
MFRHMYGKEGSRKNYTPYSCMKIIMGNPPEPGAHHGCPYRWVKQETINISISFYFEFYFTLFLWVLLSLRCCLVTRIPFFFCSFHLIVVATFLLFFFHVSFSIFIYFPYFYFINFFFSFSFLFSSYFSHMPDNQVRSLLMNQKLGSTDVNEVVKMAKEGNYQLACQKHFDITHPGHYEMDLKIVSRLSSLLSLFFSSLIS